MIFRICIKCNQEKELNKYNFISYKDDKYIYFKHKCRICCNKEACEKYRLQNPIKEKITQTHKICPKCNINKEINNINFKILVSNNYSQDCRKCIYKYERDRVKSKTYIYFGPIKRDPILEKACAMCKNTLPIEQFRICETNGKYGTNFVYSCYCNKCNKIRYKKYKKGYKTPEQILDELEKAIDWELSRKERNLATVKRARIARRKKIKETPLLKLRFNISNTISKALMKAKTSKGGQSILKYLNYTIEDLKNHLEKQFDEHMSWANYGSYWHLDHIKPHSDFPYTSMDCQEFKECWGLENLRPLEAKQNILDGCTRIRHKIKINRNNRVYY